MFIYERIIIYMIDIFDKSEKNLHWKFYEKWSICSGAKEKLHILLHIADISDIIKGLHVYEEKDLIVIIHLNPPQLFEYLA